MKIRPLFLLADLEVGGAQRVVLTVIRYLNREVFDPHLGIINSDGPMVKEIPDKVQVHDLKVKKVRYAVPKLLKLCWSVKPDTIISTLPHLNLSLLTAKCFLPAQSRLVVREANTASIRIRHTNSPFLYRLLYKKLYPYADRIICNSFYMKEDLVSNFSIPSKNITVIRNPVNEEKAGRKFEDDPFDRKVEKVQLVSVGRLIYQKGFDLLLKAFHFAGKKAPNIYLTIVGGGPEEERLKREAADLKISDRVHFTGHRDNPFDYMVKADLCISPSRWEGLPNVVLEALACGTPVLAFDCPGGTSEILVDKKNGWLIPAEDWEAMGGKIIQIVKAREWIGLGNTGLLPPEFRCGEVVNKYEEVIKEGVRCQVSGVSKPQTRTREPI